MTDPAKPTNTIVYVTAEGLPDVWVNGDDIELAITQPVSAVEAVIIIPLADARAWIAEAYVAVTVACADRTGDHQALAELAGIEPIWRCWSHVRNSLAVAGVSGVWRCFRPLPVV